MFKLILLSLIPAIYAEEVCDNVSVGSHYKDGDYLGVGDISWVTGNHREVKLKFDQNTVEYEGIDCMSSWNKLWGSSRCGYFNQHHYDSDRFVWRKKSGESVIELASYSYDLSVVPYKANDGNLL